MKIKNSEYDKLLGLKIDTKRIDISMIQSVKPAAKLMHCRE